MKIFSKMRNFSEFAKTESMGGIALFFSASIALFIANTQWQNEYVLFWSEKVFFGFSDYTITFTVADLINNFLMSFFFLLVGLEIKRQMIDGELNSLSKSMLPAIGAIGGIAFPALFYVVFNHGEPVRANGWAIPVATDIAFALGIILLLGKKVPLSLRIFLTALAIFDDLVAIVIIGLFYSNKLSVLLIFVAAFLCVVLYALNRLEVTRIDAYVVVGFAVWLAVLGSGLHATLAGVLIAFFIPQRKINGFSLATRIEHGIHGYVVLLVLPIFAFANAGLSFDAFSLPELMKPVSMGVLTGLFIGKPLGIFLAVWLAIAVFRLPMPRESRWMSILGVGFICGIGFTMSAFMNILAFGSHADYLNSAKTGIMMGSFLSALVGMIILSAFPAPSKDFSAGESETSPEAEPYL